MARSILGRRNALCSWGYLIFKDTSNHRVVLLVLELSICRLSRSSWGNQSLRWVRRTDIVVLKAVPTLTIGSLRGILVPFRLISLALRIGSTALGHSIVGELKPSYIACNSQRSD